MKKSVLSIALLTGVALTAQANQPSEAEARGLVKDYMSQLKPALMKSMKEGGPVNSIDVCHTKAPQIAHDLTQKSGWKINRVSLKPRAVNAKPDAWEKPFWNVLTLNWPKASQSKAWKFPKLLL